MSTKPARPRLPKPVARLLAEGPPGPFRQDFWRSPIRGPWLASILSSALLPLIVICALTGFLSHAAYDPDLGRNSTTGASGNGFSVYGLFDWPTSPAWLYALNQGLHVGSGLAAFPILLAKLWAVLPQLFEWPPLRSVAHALERVGLALLVGGSLFVFFTGVLNIQYFYPWAFSFVPAHYYGAFVFLAALALHIALKFGTLRRSFRTHGVVEPLRDGLEQTRPEKPRTGHSTAPDAPGRPTISRRGALAMTGAGSLLLASMAAGQSIGGAARDLALLAPRTRDYGPGPNDFQINKTAEAAGVTPDMTGASWRLEVRGAGAGARSFSREELLAMPLVTASLPIGCVEGWSTTQSWTGVRLADLARLVAGEGTLLVESLQPRGAFSATTLNRGQVLDPDSLLALKVNGADLSADHGFPARIIVPALPGVHNTKWVSSLTFGAEG